MPHILYGHDAEFFAITKGEIYQRLGHEVTVCETARECLSAIARVGTVIDVAVIHKDIGDILKEGIGIDSIAQALWNQEPLIRLLIISGEAFHGLNHVLNLGADGYFHTNLEANNPWLLHQLASGLVSPVEFEQRGKRVATPMGFKER